MAAVPSIGRASLVEAPARAPQAAATEGLYERHSAKILGYCMHQLGSREEAEDAVQTTFMNAFRALGRGVVPESESAWLFKIAENVCLSRRRSSWRRGRVESPSDFDVIEEIVPGPTRHRDELIGIEEALASMPEQQRRAILLREWQGLSYREISEELEVSQSAVETLIFRARRSLAQGLEQPERAKQPKRKGFRRALHVADVGALLAAAKTLLAGSAAVQATAAAVAVTAVAGAASVKNEGHSPQPAEDGPAVVAKAPKASKASAPVVAEPAVAPAVERVRPAQTRPSVVTAPRKTIRAKIATAKVAQAAPTRGAREPAPAPAPQPAPVPASVPVVETPAPAPPPVPAPAPVAAPEPAQPPVAIEPPSAPSVQVPSTPPAGKRVVSAPAPLPVHPQQPPSNLVLPGPGAPSVAPAEPEQPPAEITIKIGRREFSLPITQPVVSAPAPTAEPQEPTAHAAPSDPVAVQMPTDGSLWPDLSGFRRP